MSLDSLITVLEPAVHNLLPFEAKKRSVPRRQAPPLVWHLRIPYRKWDGPPLPWAEDFGKKGGQVYSRDGDEPLRSCNEVEVAKRLRRVRQHAFWVSSYSPSEIPALWRPWTIGPSEAPSWLLKLDEEIRSIIRQASGGTPDVVAWDERDPRKSALFVECKGAKESFKEGQEDWVAAALRCGIPNEHIAVAVRPW
jgi:hypothetical protein